MTTQSKLIVAVAVMASLLEIIDTSIVNVALPTMMGNLGATLEDISMVITGYVIANAIVLPVSGWLSERLGRRTYFLGCIVAFTLTSVACGLAPNLWCLTIFRIFQGTMGGALLPTSQALIYEQFPKEKAGIAGAIFGMSVMIGPAMGPVLGGYLTDHFGWRSIFNINLPLGLLAFLVGSKVIFSRPKTAAEKADEASGVERERPTFDGVGLALLILGIGCLQFVLERGEADDWFSSKAIITNIVMAAVCLPTFVWWELRTKHPIINVRLFRQSIVVNGVALMSALGFFLYAVVFLLPVFVSLSYHYTATQIGLLFIPGSLLTMFMMPIIGRMMAGGVDSKKMIFVGLFSLELCMLLMTRFSPQSSQTEILHMLYLRGFALSFLFVPLNSSILSQFTGADLGEVSGLLNLFRQIGGSAGIALVATLLTVNGRQNYLDIANNVSLLKPSTQMQYYSMTGALHNKFSSSVGMASGTEAAVRAIYGRMQAQVFALSFNQLMWLMMFIFALSLIPWYYLKLEKVTRVVDAH